MDQRVAGGALPTLTGLRFLAAVAVFGGHFSGATANTPVRHFDFALGQGGLGVDFFFVLSGFILVWSARPAGTVRDFYRRRFARIYPAYLFTWLVGALLLFAETGLPTWKAVGASFALLQTWTPKLDVVYAINPVAWSLSCEAFFYALFPLTLALIRARSGPAVHAAAIALAVLWIGLGVVAEVSHANRPSTTVFWLLNVAPPVRFVEFAIGMLACQLYLMELTPPICLKHIVRAVLLTYLAAGFAHDLFGHLLVPLLALMFVAIAQADLAGRPGFFAHPVAVRLGLWSYCFYLLHVIVGSQIERVLGTPATLGTALVFGAAMLTASIAAAAATYRLIEHPLERRIRGSDTQTRRAAAA